MAVRNFSRDILAAKPWKNGGGSTREIACWPAGNSLDDFGWRVSIATIAADGPFSVFAGVDRSIMLLEGDGVRLHSDDGEIDHRLDVRHQPFVFSGDAAVDCDLLGGASMDFNVMTRRGAWQAEVQVLRRAASIPAAPHGVLLALRGDWHLKVGGARCREGDGLCWLDDAQAWQAMPVDAGALLAVVRILPA